MNTSYYTPLPRWYWAVLVVGSVLIIAIDSFSDGSTAADWLVRSCIGEAGWGGVAGDSPECAAIWHIYRKRSIATGLDIVTVTRRYSAAVKYRSRHHRPWVFGIRRECTKPDGWPRNLDWSRYQPICHRAYALVDRYLSGELPDPLPDAIHFGGRMDHWRAPPGWARINARNYRNFFYRRR